MEVTLDWTYRAGNLVWYGILQKYLGHNAFAPDAIGLFGMTV